MALEFPIKSEPDMLRAVTEISIQHNLRKRLFDFFFSLFFLIFFSPLLLLTGLLVAITSKGPIFYKSRRLGRGGKIIECLKFRSMYQDADDRLHTILESDHSFRKEWEMFQKLKYDPRITPLGRYLRKTSLDELPQFWNVLKGDLSLVGPRPPTLLGPQEQFIQEISLLYGDKTNTILSVRPGITGLWQISGRSHISFSERCAIEEKYALNHTLWQDLVILAKTIPAVFFSKGAF